MARRVRDTVAWLAGLIGAVVIGVWVLPKVADYREMAATIEALSAVEVLGLLGLGLGGIAINGWATAITLPGLSWARGVQSTVCANFLTALVPTGADLAVRFAMYRSWGFAGRQATTAVAVAGLGRYLTLLSLPLLGMSAVLISGRGDEKTAERLGIGFIGFLVLVIVPWALLRRETIARRFAYRVQRVVHWVAALMRRQPPAHVAESMLKTHDLIVTQARRRWPIITGGQLAACLANAVVLLAAVRFVGLGSDLLSWTEVLYAFALGTIGSVIPLTPGNVGVTELILLGVLGLGAANMESQILAAALLYRIFTWMLPIPLGVAAYLLWRYRPDRKDRAPG